MGGPCLGGDFNVVRFLGENRVGSLTSPMRRFSLVIDNLELKDLALRGGNFTWKRGPEQPKDGQIG